MDIGSLYDIETSEAMESDSGEGDRPAPILTLNPAARWILFLIKFTAGFLLLYRVALRFMFIYPSHRPTWYSLSYQALDLIMGLTFCALGADLFTSKAVLKRHPKMAAVIAMAFSGVNALYIYHRYGDVLHAGLGTLTFADLARFLIMVSGVYLGARILTGKPVIKRSTFVLISVILLTDAANYVFYFKLPYFLLVQPDAFTNTRMVIQAVQLGVLIIAAAFSLNLSLGRTPAGDDPHVITLPWYVRGGIFLFGLHFILWGLQETLVNTRPLWDSFAIHPSFALVPIILTLKGLSIALASFYPWKLPLGDLGRGS